MGQLVRTLVDGGQTAGDYIINWDEKDNNGNLVTSGIYFVKLKLDDGVSQNKKLLLSR
jgi:flagellar hook assembly protein FlgD